MTRSLMATLDGRFSDAFWLHVFGSTALAGTILLWILAIAGYQYRWSTRKWVIVVSCGVIAFLAYWGIRLITGTVPGKI